MIRKIEHVLFAALALMGAGLLLASDIPLWALGLFAFVSGTAGYELTKPDKPTSDAPAHQDDRHRSRRP